MPRTNSFAVMVVLSSLLGSVACKPPEDPATPDVPLASEGDTWTPDETRETPTLEPEPTPEMSEEQRLAEAKLLFVDAETKAAAGDGAAALDLYERAYHLVPSKHGFALKVAVTAETLKNCEKAITFYEHFVRYAEPEKFTGEIAKAQKKLDTLKTNGC